MTEVTINELCAMVEIEAELIPLDHRAFTRAQRVLEGKTLDAKAKTALEADRQAVTRLFKRIKSDLKPEYQRGFLRRISEVTVDNAYAGSGDP